MGPLFVVRLSCRAGSANGEKRPTNSERSGNKRYAGVIRKLMSTAVADCVSAPTEMKSTPVSA